MEDLRKELEEAKAKIAEIEKKIKEKQEEEKAGRWKPDSGEYYYYVSGCGEVQRSTFKELNSWDIECFEFGNCFETEEEAKFILEKLKVIAELKKYAEPKDRVWDGNNNHYFIYYDVIDGKIEINFRTIIKLPTIHFESEVKAKEAIEAVGEDRIKKYYLEVE